MTSAFTPTSLPTLAAIGASLAAMFVVARRIVAIPSATVARSAGWALLLTAGGFLERLSRDEPPGVRLLSFIVVLMIGMKAIVTVESYATGDRRLSAARWTCFTLLWAGMRPGAFARLGGPASAKSSELIRLGLNRLAAGVMLYVVACLVWQVTASRFAATVVLLPALSLIFHFGFFNLLAGYWSGKGAKCDRLFKSPARSTSLVEFWGRRWNLAFSEMTALAVVRPLQPLIGTPPAVFAGFLFSGAAHEWVFSGAVRAGFGLPTAYFALHGVLVLVERGLRKRGIRIDRRPRLGRLWVALWVIVPLPLCFHVFFLRGTLWPLLDFPEMIFRALVGIK